MNRILRWLTVLILLLGWNNPVLAGERKAYIYYNPPAEIAGAVARAGVVAEGVEGLRGYQIRITFDPKVVQVVDADPGTKGIQVQPGNMFRDVPAAVNMVDNTGGEIVFSAANPGYEITGTAELIWFNYKKVGAADPSMAIADGGVLIVDTEMKETRVKSEPAPSELSQLKATKNKAPELPSEKGPEQKTSSPLEIQNDKAAETGSQQRPLKDKADKVGQTITFTGGILLTGLIADYLYCRKRRKRRR